MTIEERLTQVQCQGEGGLPQGEMSAAIIVGGTEMQLEPLEEGDVNRDGYRYFEYIPR